MGGFVSGGGEVAARGRGWVVVVVGEVDGGGARAGEQEVGIGCERGVGRVEGHAVSAGEV